MQIAGSASTSAAPALAWARQAQWLLAPGSVVAGVEVVDATTVRLLVADPLVTDPHGRAEADRLAADSARTVLEQAGHGVRLLPVTRLGYVGQVRELAPAQLTFITGLPGVQRYDLQREDLDGDGLVAPDEIAHHVDADSEADVRRLDWLLRDRFTEGSIQDGPVRIGVPEHPWRIAPDPVS